MNSPMPFGVIAAGIAALIGVTGVALAQTGNFSGTWDTNMGRMRIEQYAGRASGEYEMKDGHVRGHIDGRTFEGIWTQARADRRCFEERMGSEYWGRFRLHLSRDGDRLHGSWSYCNDEPGSGGDWHGERITWHPHPHD